MTEILEKLQEACRTNQHTTPNETGRGEENIILESIRSVLLRDEV